MLVPDSSTSSDQATVNYISSKIDRSEICITSTGRLECPRSEIKSYKNHKHLFRHMRHECGIEKRFPCTVCPTVFKQKMHLQRHHSNVHDSERNFPCTVCTKIFKRQEDLQRHIRNVHYMERRFPCTECKKNVQAKCTGTLRVYIVSNTWYKHYTFLKEDVN